MSPMKRSLAQAAVVAFLASQAAAQAGSFDVQSQSLDAALRDFARQAGVQLSIDASLAAHVTAPAVVGEMSPDEALRQLLSTSGLGYSMSPAGAVSVFAQPTTHNAVAGQTFLDRLLITMPRGGWLGTRESVYEAAGDVDYISQEEIQRIPTSTVGDILRATSGVLAGDTRSSGSLNVNIHGMQGQGRVPVTVDGAQNWATAYRGYQGNSDRSFVDPDFIGGMAISKGPQTSASGVAGSVAIRTLSVDDVLRDGADSGFRLRLNTVTNTTDRPATLTGQNTTGSDRDGWFRRDTNDRPALLEPTGGGGSLAYAARGDWGHVVVAYSQRSAGNYHAGTNGPTPNYVLMPCAETRYASNCRNYPMQWNADADTISSFWGGEQVLNTSFNNNSILVKSGLNLTEHLRWDLSFMNFNTAFGEAFTRQLTHRQDTTQQRDVSQTELNSLSSEMTWDPESDLVDLRWKIWGTDLVSESAPSNVMAVIRPTSVNRFWGTEVANTSLIGDWTLNYGASYVNEDTRPTNETRWATGRTNGVSNVQANQDDGPLRDGTRDEVALWLNGEWDATADLQIFGGLRGSWSQVDDRSTNPLAHQEAIDYQTLAPSIGLRYQLSENTGVYASYATGYRHPSLTETALAYGLANPSDPNPEQSRNLDIGLNHTGYDALMAGDELSVKVGYFNNTVDGYIGRAFEYAFTNPDRKYGLYYDNMDRAEFEGLYLNADYAYQGLNLGLSATYYSAITFCPTADTCDNVARWADFATNHIPPRLQLALDASKTLLGDRLTLGGRVTYVGDRAIDTEASPAENRFNLPMSVGVDWAAHTVLDLYATYEVTEDAVLNLGIQNLTDQYYIDPASTGRMPAPGRALSVSLDYRF